MEPLFFCHFKATFFQKKSKKPTINPFLGFSQYFQGFAGCFFIFAAIFRRVFCIYCTISVLDICVFLECRFTYFFLRIVYNRVVEWVGRQAQETKTRELKR